MHVHVTWRYCRRDSREAACYTCIKSVSGLSSKDFRYLLCFLSNKSNQSVNAAFITTHTTVRPMTTKAIAVLTVVCQLLEVSSPKVILLGHWELQRTPALCIECFVDVKSLVLCSWYQILLSITTHPSIQYLLSQHKYFLLSAIYSHTMS